MITIKTKKSEILYKLNPKLSKKKVLISWYSSKESAIIIESLQKHLYRVLSYNLYRYPWFIFCVQFRFCLLYCKNQKKTGFLLRNIGRKWTNCVCVCLCLFPSTVDGKKSHLYHTSDSKWMVGGFFWIFPFSTYFMHPDYQSSRRINETVL